MTYLLLPLLQATARATAPGDVRIVCVTSDGHDSLAPKGGIKFDDLKLESVSAMVRYGHSKLANVLHAKELHRIIGPKEGAPQKGEIWVTAVHPGHIDT